MKIKIITFAICFISIISNAQTNYVSKVWVADNGDGTYRNPIINADYSDPDVCRIGDDFYMTSSSFNCVPGLQILHSNDLVNWTIIGAAFLRQHPDSVFNVVQHGNGVWAPSIRYHNGEFYIYYGDPDFGIYMTKTKNPRGEWEPVTLVKQGKGLIDPCPLFDDNGDAYLVYAYAGSRAGIKSVVLVSRMTADGKKTIGESRVVYDGHDDDPTIEGTKFYKRNGLYYIFAPAGGVKTGWQVVLKSKNLFGPYERKVVLAQGKTDINGPHQGAWVDTPTGENWFVHFQDCYAYGRVVHLQPMFWNGDDFPVIGIDKENKACGEPVKIYKKPDVGKTYPICTPQENDDFGGEKIGLQWQWHANAQPWWGFINQLEKCLSLYSVPVPDAYKNLWDVSNFIGQKTPATNFTVTTKITFKPNVQIKGERAGFMIFGLDYAGLFIEKNGDGYTLSQIECNNADKGSDEKIHDKIDLKSNTVYCRINVRQQGVEHKIKALCTFEYSRDGKKYHKIGKEFTAREGKWIGAKIGYVCSRPTKNNDGGRLDVDWISFEK